MMLLMGMWMSLTKKPMKPMSRKPTLVALAILVNSVVFGGGGTWRGRWQGTGGWGGERASGGDDDAVPRRGGCRRGWVRGAFAKRRLTLAVGLGALLDELDALRGKLLERLDHGGVDLRHGERRERAGDAVLCESM